MQQLHNRSQSILLVELVQYSLVFGSLLVRLAHFFFFFWGGGGAGGDMERFNLSCVVGIPGTVPLFFQGEERIETKEYLWMGLCHHFVIITILLMHLFGLEFKLMG